MKNKETKKSYEYYHEGRTPADDGIRAAKRENSMRKEPVKVIWMMADEILNISYHKSLKEAEKRILNSSERRWGKAYILFYSERLNKYVTVPDNKK